jgi:LDH2 family malate/lactate/ureidoglycolate dehydrogenase
MTQGLIYISPDALKTFTNEVFERLGLLPEDASLVSDCLVKANLRGVDSHGVSRIPIYAKRLRLKLVNPKPNIRATRVAPAASLVDGDDGMGMVVGTRAMAEAIAIAGESGVGLTGVRRSTHYGMAAYYVLQAISQDCIGFAFSNASPGMPPWGGSKPVLGVNPIAVGVPAGRRPPFLLDMAMSVMARGKIRLAALRGEPIPEGIALDAQGRPTTDGSEVFKGGTVLPFGGYKGSGLALWMEIMGGVFTGAAFAGEMRSLYDDFSGPQRIGHAFMAIRPGLFMPLEEFKDRMDTMIERYRNSPKAEEFDEILMPGELEEREETKRRTTGIPVPPEIAQELRREAEELGVLFPESESKT